MPDENPKAQPQPQVASQDSNGYVHVELDVPPGAQVTQPLDPGQPIVPPPTVTGVSAAAVPAAVKPVPVTKPADPSTDDGHKADASKPGDEGGADVQAAGLTDSAKPPQVAQAEQHFDAAKTKEQQAREQATKAIKEVKELESEAKQTQEQLQAKAAAAQAKLKEAEQNIKEAQAKHAEGQKQVEELQQGSSESGGGPSIAGYKPLDLAQALVRPPQAASADVATTPPVDKKVQEDIEHQAHETEASVKETQAHIAEAHKDLKQTEQTAIKTHTSEGKLFDKLSALLKSFAGTKESSSPNLSRTFLIVGAVLLVLALLLLIVLPPVIAALLGILGIVQIGIGIVMKRKGL